MDKMNGITFEEIKKIKKEIDEVLTALQGIKIKVDKLIYKNNRGKYEKSLDRSENQKCYCRLLVKHNEIKLIDKILNSSEFDDPIP